MGGTFSSSSKTFCFGKYFGESIGEAVLCRATFDKFKLELEFGFEVDDDKKFDCNLRRLPIEGLEGRSLESQFLL